MGLVKKIAVKYCAVQGSKVKYCAVQGSEVKHCAVQGSKVKHCAVPGSAVLDLTWNLSRMHRYYPGIIFLHSAYILR